MEIGNNREQQNMIVLKARKSKYFMEIHDQAPEPIH